MATNKNNNKSLFLYTGLIFVVAVLLIILSFFGQMNLQKNQPKTEETEEQIQTNGITERAAVLSEENKNLIEENSQLKQENGELLQKITDNDTLLAANGYFSLGVNDKALEMLEAVDYDSLSSDQQIIYDAVKEGLDAAE